ncbi:MAG: spore coat protein CotH [Ruminococcus sp.]|nr:spore coat protein CotH [Ruminococcus sp.]
MIDSKRLTLFAAVSVAAAVLICVLLAVVAGSPAAETFSVSSEPLYAEKIFGADIITIDINADEAEWQQMLDNAMSEQYIMVNMAVNGKKFSNVGIRPKGNNSLQQVASSDSDRYSFKIKFDEYADGQTCFGLDMLVLNDMLGDATYMKEYTTFDMMREMGIETPYFGYAMITLNGEDWGLYFALEAYNDSYKQRVSGDESGNLYNIKSSSGGFGHEENSTDMGNPPERQDRNFSENSDGSENSQTRSFGRGGMGGMGGMGASSSGGSLVYTDDESSSYSAIFGNAVGSGSDEEDYQKVIAALKALNDGENIEEYFDVDEILRYLAVHTVVVNLDSYSSGMAQNYYIYEYDGVLQILPWDYNYAWGAFQSGSSSAVVNFPIDTPVSSVDMSERPLIAKLFENEEYFERYHKYLSELMENYFDSGNFDKKIDELNALIGGYVQKDPTAFYTYDEYLTALDAFKNIGKLRAESISGQLDGTVPSTTESQRSGSDKLIDASSVKLSELGSGGFGGGGDRDGFGNFGGFGRFGKTDNSENEREGFGSNSENKFDENGDYPEPNGGEFPGDFGENESKFGFDENSGFPAMIGGELPKDFGGTEADRSEQQERPIQPPNGDMLDESPPDGFPQDGFKPDGGRGENKFGSDFGSDESGGFPALNGGEFPKDFGENESAPFERQDTPVQPPDGEMFGGDPPDGFPQDGFKPDESSPDTAGNDNAENLPPLPDQENSGGREFAADEGFPQNENAYSRGNAEMSQRGMRNSRPDGHATNGENRGSGTSSAVMTAVCLGTLIAAIFGASLVKRNF